MITNITEEHRHAFEVFTSGDYGNFAIFSIFVDGAPGTAIVAVNEGPSTGEGSEPKFEFLEATPTPSASENPGPGKSDRGSALWNISNEVKWEGFTE